MLSPNRHQALADTLDWLEAQGRAGPVQVRIGTHDGRSLEGILRSVTRRDVQVSPDSEAPPVTLPSADIARIWVADPGTRASEPQRWEVWFDTGARSGT